MSYELAYRPEVVKDDIPALDSAVKLRIREAIEDKLKFRPELFGIPLRQSLKGCRKLRVGHYRVVFVIKKQRVEILVIQHRSQIYLTANKRLG